MAKRIIDDSTLEAMANALRKVTGENRTYTPTEMIEAVTNIMDSATYILVDEDGNEIPAVYVDSETILTATANDIREGAVAVTDEGITTGEKVIPSYNTSEGYQAIMPGDELRITGVTDYEYTKLQVLVCAFNSSISDIVATEKVSINSKVYTVNSTTEIANVVIDIDDKAINLGITNNGSNSLIIRYFMYKEIS